MIHNTPSLILKILPLLRLQTNKNSKKMKGGYSSSDKRMTLWKEIGVLIFYKRREDLLVRMNMSHLGGDYFIILCGLSKEWKGNNSLKEGLNHCIYFPLHLSWKLLKIKNSISWFISVLPTPPHSLPPPPFFIKVTD